MLIARELGKTVAELDLTLSTTELLDWVVFFRLEKKAMEVQNGN